MPPPAGVPRAAPRGVTVPLSPPVLRQIAEAARLPLPCLIAAEGARGQDRAIRHLAAKAGVSDIRQLPAAEMTADQLATLFAVPIRPPPQAGMIVITAVEEMSANLQARLAKALSSPSRGPVAVTAQRSLRALAEGAIVRPLWVRLAPLAIELPPLARPAHLMRAVLARASAQLGIPVPAVAPEVWTLLDQGAAPGGTETLEALATAALIAARDGAPITGRTLGAQIDRLNPPLAEGTPPPDSDPFGTWLDSAFDGGTFSLSAHEAQIREAALARSDGNMAAAARLLGISRPQLAYRMGAARPKAH